MRLEFCFSRQQWGGEALTQGPVLSSWPFASAAAFDAPSALSAANTRLLLTILNYSLQLVLLHRHFYVLEVLALQQQILLISLSLVTL